MTLLLSIDWSPDGTAVRIIDVAARSLLAESCHAHERGDGHEVDDWVRTTIATAHDALESLVALGPTAADIEMVDVRTTAPGGLLALDATGTPVHGALLGSHVDSATDTEWLLDRVDGGSDGWLAATGVLPVAGSTAALLSFLHRTDPDAWRAMVRCALPVSLLAERLGAAPALSVHDAAGTAVADRRLPRTWCTDLLALIDDGIDWSATMPPIVDTATPVGVFDADLATDLGIRTDRPLHVGATIAS